MDLDLVRDAAREWSPPADAARYTRARIWHCKYRSLAALAHLRGLTELVIATYPDPTFEPLVALERLEILSIVHLPRIVSLEPLARLPRLHTLELRILPGWGASKKQIVDSLEPLARMPALRHLELVGVREKAGSLRALEACPQLETALLWGISEAEIARFHARGTVVSQPNPAIAPFAG
jgi:hypothetical protein